ncbi:MAG: aromatic ring-hydroxylating dioxygenase subunit alpha [Gemmatimonadota bacterium]
MSFVATTRSYQQGAHTMPGRYYTSQEVFEREQPYIMETRWLCIGRADQLKQANDYFLQAIGRESIIVLKDKKDVFRAFYNVCRHRGTQICEAAQGRFKETIQCPYHAWTYATDGRLIGTPHMQEAEDFDKADFPLRPVAIHEWEGFLFLHLGANPESFESANAALIGRFSRFNLPSLKVGKRIEYDVNSNWKLVFQNYSECLHCPVIHPELSSLMPYTSGANDLIEGNVLGGYMIISEPNKSMTMTGRSCGLRLGNMPEEDYQRAYYYTIFPNLMLSIHPDYVVYYTLWPQAAGRTKVVCEWMFHPGSFGLADFNPEDAVEFWDTTNRQDWHITERSFAGISSRSYEPGPYSPRESVPAAWDRAFLEAIKASGL